MGYVLIIISPVQFWGFQLLLTSSSNIFDSITVGQSINVMAWDCQSPEAIAFNNFTILYVVSIISSTPSPQLTHTSISNVNANVFTGELAFIAIQANDQCSVNISPDQVNQNPGPGYILSFANIINETEVSRIFNILYFWPKLTQLILGLRFLSTIRDQTPWIIVS